MSRLADELEPPQLCKKCGDNLDLVLDEVLDRFVYVCCGCGKVEEVKDE